MLMKLSAVAALAVMAGAAVPRARPTAPVLKPSVVKITARNYAFEMPDRIPAGVTTFELTNAGTELHHVQIIRIDSGKTFDDLMAAFKQEGPPPAWAVFVGGPNAPAPGGGVSTATLNLKAGNYGVICLIPSPGETAPHFTKGMLHPLTVTPIQTVANSMPKSDITITTSDYAFTFSRPITKGMHSLKLKNSMGPQFHEVEVVRLAPGKNAQDMLSWIQKMEGPPPGEPLGGITAINKGQDANFFINFTPGEYAVFCFLPAPDGKDHAAHGMFKQFTVK